MVPQYTQCATNNAAPAIFMKLSPAVLIHHTLPITLFGIILNMVLGRRVQMFSTTKQTR